MAELFWYATAGGLVLAGMAWIADRLRDSPLSDLHADDQQGEGNVR